MSGSGKSNMHTYGVAQDELFLFYQTNVLLKTWFLSSWGLCEESLGCCWHCRAQGFQARGRQINYCEHKRRKTACFGATFTRYTRQCTLSQDNSGTPPRCVGAKSLQSCLTLWEPMDCGLTGSSVHGILQARILEWVAMPSSRGSSTRYTRSNPWWRYKTRNKDTWIHFLLFFPCFFLSTLKCDFLSLRTLSLQIFSRKYSP